MTETEVAGYAVSPIGVVHCSGRYRFEAPRQGVFADNEGVIKLNKGSLFEQAAADLHGFSRIWVIFLFHLNQTWNVKVSPPVAPSAGKIGVFATRSPHRPNRIGMSCVELVRVEGLNVHIRNFDMLDLTPVLDIKPYIPAADSFPDARTGWLEAADARKFSIDFAPEFLRKNDFIVENGGPDLANFCRVQLSFSPLDASRRRLYPRSDGSVEIGCRTWRICFEAETDRRIIRVRDVHSNFSPAELNGEDRYGDLELHRKFIRTFVSSG